MCKKEDEKLNDVEVVLDYLEKSDWFIKQIQLTLFSVHNDDFIHIDTFVTEDDKVNYHFIGCDSKHEEIVVVDPVVFTTGYEERLSDELTDLMLMLSKGKPVSVTLH